MKVKQLTLNLDNFNSEQQLKSVEKFLNQDKKIDRRIEQLTKDRDSLLIRIAELQNKLHAQYDPMHKDALSLQNQLEERINQLEKECDYQQREIYRLSQDNKKLINQLEELKKTIPDYNKLTFHSRK
ncbi:MAG: hypothetical protein AB4060_13580 [Crocosphaera sp.]